MRNSAASQGQLAGWHLLLVTAVMLLVAGSAGAWYFWPRTVPGAALGPANGFQGLGGFNPDDMKDMKSWEEASKEMTEEEKKEMEEQLAKLGMKPDGNMKVMKGGGNQGSKAIFMSRRISANQKNEEEKEPESTSEANSGSNPTAKPMVRATAPLFGGKKPASRGSKVASLLILLTSMVGSGCFLWLAMRQRNA